MKPTEIYELPFFPLVFLFSNIWGRADGSMHWISSPQPQGTFILTVTQLGNKANLKKKKIFEAI